VRLAMPLIILLIGSLMAVINEKLLLGAGSHTQLLIAFFIGGFTIGGIVTTIKIRRPK